MAKREKLPKIIKSLVAHYGEPAAPLTSDPFELVLLENVAYLVSDERRQQAFHALRESKLRPIDILSASHEQLLDVTRLGGMHPEQRVERLRRIAEIALQEFGGDLTGSAKEPLARAKRAMKKFPSVGDPGAEKILLFSRAHRVLALDSNGLRVLQRVGFGEDRKSYAATYRSVQEAAEKETEKEFDWLITAHQILRRHGQQLCKNVDPQCPACPIRKLCRYYKEHSRRVGLQPQEDGD